MRFNELKRLLPRITQRMLTRQLRELEADKLIARKVYPKVLPRVEYSITDYGKTLAPIIQALRTWGIQHLRRSEVTQEEPVTQAESVEASLKP